MKHFSFLLSPFSFLLSLRIFGRINSTLLFSFVFSMAVLLIQDKLSAQAPTCTVPSGSVELFYASVTTATVYNNQTIHITGTVSFNANITMTACTVLMEPNAVLNIANNSVFTILASSNSTPTVIKGCTAMWNSINVLPGSAIDWRNSTIRDGITALNVSNNFRDDLSSLIGMTFIANSVAIAANGVKNLNFVTFTGNSFVGRESGASALLPPHSTLEPIYALRLDNVAGSIGTSGAVNTFRRNSVAARVQNSTLTVNNATFQDNVIQDWEGFGSGVGVWATNSFLTIENYFSNGASCSFIGNKRGLRTDQTMSLNLQNAVFRNQQVVDVEVLNSINSNNIKIISNNFTLGNPTEHSIFVERAAQTTKVHTEIRSNILNLPHGGNWLTNNIRFIEVRARPGATDGAKIADNQIRCDYGNTGTPTKTIDGIWIEDTADGYAVSGNIINYQSNDPLPNARIGAFGIAMFTGSGIHNDVGPNNTITSRLYAAANPGVDNFMESWLRCGIHVSGGTNVRVCRNDVDDVRHAYHFDANCSNGEFGRNKIRDAFQGLAISGMFPNNHDYRKNEWIPGSGYNEFSARWKPANVPVGLMWRVDGSLPGNFPPATISPNNWFISLPNGGVDGSNCSNLGAGFDTPPTGDLAKKFLNNEYSGLNTAVATWDFERNLLEIMLRFPNTYTGDATAVSYYNARVNTSAWKFAKAERMLHDGLYISSTQQNSLDALYEIAQAKADSVVAIDVAEGVDINTITPGLQSQKRQLIAEADGLMQQQQSLNHSIRSTQLSNLVGLRSYIESLPEVEVWEQYNKTVLRLQAKYAAGENWTVQDTAAIRVVAYACPTMGGNSVIVARGMLPSPETNNFVWEGDDPQCLDKRDLQKAGIQTVMSAMPNPANAYLVISFQEPFTGSIQVWNSLGQLMQSQQVSQVLQQGYDTDSMAPGLYWLRVQAVGQSAQTLKIYIIH